MLMGSQCNSSLLSFFSSVHWLDQKCQGVNGLRNMTQTIIDGCWKHQSSFFALLVENSKAWSSLSLGFPMKMKWVSFAHNSNLLYNAYLVESLCFPVSLAYSPTGTSWNLLFSNPISVSAFSRAQPKTALKSKIQIYIQVCLPAWLNNLCGSPGNI